MKPLTAKQSVFVLLALLAGLALALAACKGGDDKPKAQETKEPSPAAEETPGAAAGGEDTVQVNDSFWHAGWKVTLGEAALEAGDFGSATVTIEATFENLGASDATFDSQLALTSGGQSYTDAALEEELPNVPGGLSGKGVFAFSVDEEFGFDDATLIIGNPDNNQAKVPLGPQGDELVSLEPRAITVSGQLKAGALTVNVEGAELRADLPEKHSEVEKGHLALTIRFSATPSAGIQIGQGVLQNPNVALKLPDGTAVAVRSDGVSGVNELLQGKEGTTIPDLFVRFETDDPPEGEYAFVLKGKYGPGGADAQGELPFTIP